MTDFPIAAGDERFALGENQEERSCPLLAMELWLTRGH